MKICFQADVDLNQIIVNAILRQKPSIDFQTAQTANLDGLSDREVLASAAQLGRVLVSHDRKTMPLHFAAFIAREHSSGLIIISQNLSIRAAVEDIVLIWEVTEAEEWIDRIQILPL